MNHSALSRSSLIVIILVGISFPLAFWGAGESLQRMFNSPVLWIPASSETRQQFIQFTHDFHTQDIIIVSWPGCTVDDERLDQLQAVMREKDDGHAGTNPNALFEGIVTGRSAVERLRQPPLGLRKYEAVERLRGSLIGPDDVSCAVAILTLKGAIERKTAIAMIAEALEADVGISADEYRLGGTPVIGLAIDEESSRAASRLSIPAGILIFALCCLFLGSWRFVLPVLGIAFFGERLALALVSLTGSNMNAVLVVMSPLVFVLSASTGIHLSNYYLDELSLRGAPGSARRMLQIGWKPCVLSATTTAIGLLSLLVSDITAVRQFAVITSVCVVLTAFLMLIVLAGILEWWPLSAPSRERGSTLYGRFLTRLSAYVVRHRFPVVIFCLTIMVTAGWGLRNVRTEVEVFQLLTPASPIVADHRWLEENVAPLIPVEIVIRFGNRCSLTLLERLVVVRDVQAEIAASESTRGTTSALTFFPEVNVSSSVGATIQRSLLKSRFRRKRTNLANLGYLHETEDEQAWRVSTRVPAFEHIEYAPLLVDLGARTRAVLDRLDARGDVRIDTTGVMPVVDSAQQMLLSNLVGSLVTAFIVISMTIMVGLRSIRLGLVAMIPNIFPLVVVFGVMGWLNQPLDIGALMTASVALGIAVDDTVHLMTYSRQKAARGQEWEHAVTSAVQHCGRAMTHTTIICGFGLLVFSLSRFAPTQRFAWMMFLLLFSALIADLLLLPALLAGPRRRLGKRVN